VSPSKGTLLARMWLTIIVATQVFIAPVLAFTVTYIIDMDWDNYSFTIRIDLIPWILTAAAMYGLISLFLGLAVGGFMPTRVANAGGWWPVFGISRRLRDAELVDLARMRLHVSPYGQMIRIVDYQLRDRGRPLLEVHGGLQLLALPLQIVLITLPLLVLRFLPEHWLQPNRLLELSLLVYLAGLVIGLRIYPYYAKRFAGFAAVTRRILVDRTKLGWLFPVLILWLVERTFVSLAFQALDLDFSKWNSINVEQNFLEALLPITVDIPETSFLDLLVALSVLPLAIFTTIAVLGGGEKEVPKWMLKSDAMWTDLSDSPKEDTPALFAPGEGIGEAEGEDIHLTDEEAETSGGGVQSEWGGEPIESAESSSSDGDNEKSESEDEGMSTFLDKAQSFAETLGKLRGGKD